MEFSMTSVPAHEYPPLDAVTERRFLFAQQRGHEEAFVEQKTAIGLQNRLISQFSEIFILPTRLGQIIEMS